MSCLAFNEVLKALRRKFQQITGEAFLPQIVREGGFNLADLPMAGRQVHWNGGYMSLRWRRCGGTVD